MEEGAQPREETVGLHQEAVTRRRSTHTPRPGVSAPLGEVYGLRGRRYCLPLAVCRLRPLTARCAGSLRLM